MWSPLMGSSMIQYSEEWDLLVVYHCCYGFGDVGGDDYQGEALQQLLLQSKLHRHGYCHFQEPHCRHQKDFATQAAPLDYSLVVILLPTRRLVRCKQNVHLVLPSVNANDEQHGKGGKNFFLQIRLSLRFTKICTWQFCKHHLDTRERTSL